MSVLTYGQNNIEGSSLVMEFEQIAEFRAFGEWVSWFQIRPLNLSPQITPDHTIRITFSNKTLAHKHISQLKYYDGEITNALSAKPSDLFWVNIRPKKFIYLENHKACRKKPYMQEFIARLDKYFSHQEEMKNSEIGLYESYGGQN